METDTLNTYIAQAIEHHKAGNLPQAEQLYQQILAADANHVDANHLLGLIAHQKGNQPLAVRLISKAIQCNPQFAQAHYHLGNVFKANQQWHEAVTCYRRALSINPHLAQAHNNLGLVLEKAGQRHEAEASYEQALAIDSTAAEPYSNLGHLYHITGRIPQAIRSYEQSLAINPNDAEALNNLGIILLNTGSLDRGVACLRQALALRPDYAQAHKNLAYAVKHTEYDHDVAAMETLYHKEDLSDEQRMYLGFGLGRAFEELKEYNKAFDCILTANRLKRASFKYAISSDQDRFARIKAAFTESFFTAHRDCGCPDETPIFILGMPRSGTSLVEQILASHSQVFGAGELNDLVDLTQRLGKDSGTRSYPEVVLALDKEALTQLGSKYINRIRRHCQDAVYITDKMPYNFLHVGLIKAILPHAKVIHCMRDPMDNCFSIFKNDFGAVGAHLYAYDLNELGQYYTLYLKLMEHWRNTLPDFMFEIQYEALVSDQEGQTRQLLSFCGLPWEDACLSFHATKRTVATASAMQVRRPMYRDSFFFWKRYQIQLEPLRQAIYG